MSWWPFSVYSRLNPTHPTHKFRRTIAGEEREGAFGFFTSATIYVRRGVGDSEVNGFIVSSNVTLFFSRSVSAHSMRVKMINFAYKSLMLTRPNQVEIAVFGCYSSELPIFILLVSTIVAFVRILWQQAYPFITFLYLTLTGFKISSGSWLRNLARCRFIINYKEYFSGRVFFRMLTCSPSPRI